MRSAVSLSITVFLLFAPRGLSAEEPAGKVVHKQDVVYGRVQGAGLLADIAYPEGKGKPMLIIHSDNDGSVPFQQAVEMAQALEKANVVHRFSMYQKKGHMRVTDEVIKDARAFIEEVGK